MSGNDKARKIISAGVLIISLFNAITLFAYGDVSEGVVCLLIAGLFGAILLSKKHAAKNKSSKPAEPVENIQVSSNTSAVTVKSVRSCDDKSDVKPVVHTEYDFVTHKNGELVEYRGVVTDVIIPDNVKEITGRKKYNEEESWDLNRDIWDYVGAFAFRKDIRSVTIPASVTSIRRNAFEGCTGLTEVTVLGKPEGVFADMFSVPGCRMIYPDSSKYKGLSSVSIPEGTTSIGAYEFANYTNLKSVTIPDSVTEIEKYAFYGCTGLTEVTIPASVTSIKGNAFYGCTGLTEIKIYGRPDRFNALAFDGCDCRIEYVSRTKYVQSQQTE